MHKTVKIGIIIAVLGLSACSPKIAMEEGAAAAPVAVEEPMVLERKSDCAVSDMDDGIGGTGCPMVE